MINLTDEEKAVLDGLIKLRLGLEEAMLAAIAIAKKDAKTEKLKAALNVHDMFACRNLNEMQFYIGGTGWPTKTYEVHSVEDGTVVKREVPE